MYIVTKGDKFLNVTKLKIGTEYRFIKESKTFFNSIQEAKTALHQMGANGMAGVKIVEVQK